MRPQNEMKKALCPFLCLFLLSACSLPFLPGILSPAATPTILLPTITRGSTPQPVATATPTPLVIRGTISIWHAWPEEKIPALAQIVAGFHQQYPEVLFDIQYIPAEDLRRHYEVQTMANTGPALLLGPAEWGPYLYDIGLLTDLGSLVNEDALNALNTPALETARHQDILIGMPYSLEGVVLYRNKNIMTIRPETFDELVTLAQAATQGETVGAVLERGFLYSGAHFIGLGGSWMRSDKSPAFDNAKGIAWLELLNAFEQAGPPNYLSDQDLENFKAGRVGWIIDGTWNLASLADALGDRNIAIDPWPDYLDGHLSGFVIAENLYLSATVKPELQPAVQAFITYFLSPEAQEKLAEVGLIPAATNVKLIEQNHAALISEAVTALADGAPYPVQPEFQTYATQLSVTLKNYFEEKNIPPERALKNAYDAILTDLALLRMTPTPSP